MSDKEENKLNTVDVEYFFKLLDKHYRGRSLDETKKASTAIMEVSELANQNNWNNEEFLTALNLRLDKL